MKTRIISLGNKNYSLDTRVKIKRNFITGGVELNVFLLKSEL